MSPLTFYDNGLGEQFKELGSSIGERLTEKKTRAKELQKDPALMANLAQAYRAAKKAGTEAGLFKGLGVDQSEFEPMLAAFQPSAEEKFQTMAEEAGLPQLILDSQVAGAKAGIRQSQDTIEKSDKERKAGLLDARIEEELAKSKFGQATLTGYQGYIDSLPKNAEGNKLRALATVGMTNPQLLQYITSAENNATDLEIAKIKDASSGANISDMMVNYGRWKNEYDKALKNFNDAEDPKIKEAYAKELNGIVGLGEQLMAAGAIPTTPMLGAREGRGLFRKKLELFGITPEVASPISQAIEAIKVGQFEDGTPASEKEFKSSRLYASLKPADRARVDAVLATSENINTTSEQKEAGYFTKLMTKFTSGLESGYNFGQKVSEAIKKDPF